MAPPSATLGNVAIIPRPTTVPLSHPPLSEPHHHHTRAVPATPLGAPHSGRTGPPHPGPTPAGAALGPAPRREATITAMCRVPRPAWSRTLAHVLRQIGLGALLADEKSDIRPPFAGFLSTTTTAAELPPPPAGVVACWYMVPAWHGRGAAARVRTAQHSTPGGGMAPLHNVAQ